MLLWISKLCQHISPFSPHLEIICKSKPPEDMIKIIPNFRDNIYNNKYLSQPEDHLWFIQSLDGNIPFNEIFMELVFSQSSFNVIG